MHRKKVNPMTNSLTLNNSTSLATVAANLLEATQDNHAPLLKFNKGKFYAGKREVPLGTKFLAYCADWRKGWVKFKGDEIVDRITGKVADKFDPGERESLGDLDQSQWEVRDGKPSDPWSFQHYLPLENAETGERYLFVTQSIGGRIAISNLCNAYARNIVKGLPTITLGVGTFSTKKYGETQRPEFKIVGWSDASAPLPTVSEEMNDNNPF
jgi:hypothetical protein